VQFRVKDLADKFVDVFNFSVDIFLKHTEALGMVKNLESCYSTQELHRLVCRTVDTVVRIFIKNIKNRYKHRFSQISI